MFRDRRISRRGSVRWNRMSGLQRSEEICDRVLQGQFSILYVVGGLEDGRVAARRRGILRIPMPAFQSVYADTRSQRTQIMANLCNASACRGQNASASFCIRKRSVDTEAGRRYDARPHTRNEQTWLFDESNRIEREGLWRSTTAQESLLARSEDWVNIGPTTAGYDPREKRVHRRHPRMQTSAKHCNPLVGFSMCMCECDRTCFFEYSDSHDQPPKLR